MDSSPIKKRIQVNDQLPTKPLHLCVTSLVSKHQRWAESEDRESSCMCIFVVCVICA